MGYYANLELVDLHVKDVQGLTNLITNICNEVDHISEQWKWNLTCAEVAQSNYDKKYYLEFTDYLVKPSDTDKFAFELARYVSKGSLIYTGEDGEKWGYQFNGDGTVNCLYWEERVGELLTDPCCCAAASLQP